MFKVKLVQKNLFALLNLKIEKVNYQKETAVDKVK